MAVGVQRLGNVLAGEAIGAVVVVLAALVFHGSTLNLKLLLAHGVQQEAHAVSLQPQPGFELVAGQRLKIVGAVLIGGAIQAAAGGRHELKVLLVTYVVGPLKHHVLEEVREARLPNLLPRRPHVVGHIDVHQRVGVVLAHDERQAIGQHVLLVGNDELAGLLRDFLHELGAVGRGRNGLLAGGRGLARLGHGGRSQQGQAQHRDKTIIHRERRVGARMKNNGQERQKLLLPVARYYLKLFLVRMVGFGRLLSAQRLTSPPGRYAAFPLSCGEGETDANRLKGRIG